MGRFPSTFRSTDISRALKAVRAAGYSSVRVLIDKTGRIETLPPPRKGISIASWRMGRGVEVEFPPSPQPTPRPVLRSRRRQHKPRPPDGLHTPVEAAAKLRCSVKTLKGHVASGALNYVIIGHGTKRPHRMFTDGDLDQFITAQTRTDIPCRSIGSRVHRTGTSNSKLTVVAFTAAPKPRPGGKPKK